MLEFIYEGGCAVSHVDWWDCGQQRTYAEERGYDRTERFAPENQFWVTDAVWPGDTSSTHRPGRDEPSIHCAHLVFWACTGADETDIGRWVKHEIFSCRNCPADSAAEVPPYVLESGGY